LLSNLCGQEYVDATDYLQVHILHLRSKLGDDPPNPSTIATEHGIGYKFVD
jgi:two-component system KDP operon response regulator KdpE